MTTLAEHPFVAGLPEEVVERLSICGSAQRTPAGEWLFRTGEPAAAFFLITEGRIALEVAPPGGEPLIVETVDAGGAVGWSWLLTPHRWQFDARAVTDVATVRVAGECMRRAMASDPAVAAALLERFLALVADRLRHTRLQLLDVYGHVRHG